MNSMQLRNQAVQNEQLCIWMQADVVPHKFCRFEYQCAACAYDRAMRRVAAENKRLKEQDKIPIGKRGRIVFWK
ncbi:MAG: hypothetical protein PVG68_19405, partial [Desulfobacterales bacterium]